ncbi:MAG: hypothetical protein ACFFC7_04150 [Candidatus Hermodarchaeota archaeon]
MTTSRPSRHPLSFAERFEKATKDPTRKAIWFQILLHNEKETIIKERSKNNNIEKTIAKYQGITADEIASNLGLQKQKSKVYYHLKILEDNYLVKIQTQKKRAMTLKYYTVSDEYRPSTRLAIQMTRQRTLNRIAFIMGALREANELFTHLSDTDFDIYVQNEDPQLILGFINQEEYKEINNKIKAILEEYQGDRREENRTDRFLIAYVGYPPPSDIWKQKMNKTEEEEEY